MFSVDLCTEFTGPMPISFFICTNTVSGLVVLFFALLSTSNVSSYTNVLYSLYMYNALTSPLSHACAYILR